MKVTIGNYEVDIRTRDLSEAKSWEMYTRVYVWHKNASLEGNDFRKVTKHVAENIIRQLLEAETISAYGTEFKVRFQRTAGCVCGCSPGVVLDRRLQLDAHPVDIFISEK